MFVKYIHGSSILLGKTERGRERGIFFVNKVNQLINWNCLERPCNHLSAGSLAALLIS